MLVGCRKVSARETVGNTIGRPPAANTAFHGLDLFWHIAVAIVVAAGRVGNSDDRFFEAVLVKPMAFAKERRR